MIEMEREGKGRIPTSTGMVSLGSSRNKLKVAPSSGTGDFDSFKFITMHLTTEWSPVMATLLQTVVHSVTCLDTSSLVDNGIVPCL